VVSADVVSLSRSGSSRRPLLVAAYLLWLCVAAVGALHHEPWRDEADVWLAARDSSAADIFLRASHSGTPAAWYLVVMPLARAGLPYESMFVLHFIIAAISAALLLLFLPLPLPLRVPAIFSYFFLYEYVALARNYAIGALALFLASILLRRSQKPLLIALLLLIAMNSSVHAAAVALPLAFVALLGFRRASTRQRWGAVAIMLIGGLLMLWQLFPRGGGQIEVGQAALNWTAVSWAIASAMIPGVTFQPWMPIVAVVSLLALVAFLRRAEGKVFFASAVIILLAIFVAVYAVQGGERHYGFIVVAWLCAVMLGEEEERRPRILLSVVSVQFALWAVLGFWAVQHEVNTVFSGAADAARFIRADQAHRNAPLAAHGPAISSAVLPLLDRTSFYYPAEKLWGSFMVWSAGYVEAGQLRPDLAATMATRALRGSFYFLSSAQLSKPELLRFRLLYRTPSEWPVRYDERYWIYWHDAQ
jgi:hypothetical protein